MNIGHTSKRVVPYNFQAKSSAQLVDKTQAVFAAQPKTSGQSKKQSQSKKHSQLKKQTLCSEAKAKKPNLTHDEEFMSDNRLLNNPQTLNHGEAQTDESLTYDNHGRSLIGQQFDVKA